MELGESFNRRSIDNILVWACPSSAATCVGESEENLYPPSLSQRRRASFAAKHPLLAKLEEAEEDVKHSDYTAHLLIQKQTREYAFTVENAIVLLKKGTEQIIDSLTYWRGCECDDEVEEDENTYPSWVKAASGTLGEEDISRVGREIVTISEVIKNLQDQDALTFWACEERQLIWNLLVSASKETVKLRRKLNRIKGSLEDRVRNVRRAAILCECEITGNLVPSEIYYQWVNEDAKTNQSKSKFKFSMENSEKPKTKLDLFKDAAFKLIRSNKHETTISDDAASSTISSLYTAPLRFYPQKRCSKKMEEELRNKMTHDVFDEANNVSNTSFEEHEENLRENMSRIPLEEAWSPKPSPKLMDLITANLESPSKFGSATLLFDNEDSCTRNDEPNMNEMRCLNSSDLAILNDHQNASTSNNNNFVENVNEIDHDHDAESVSSSEELPDSSSGQKNHLSEAMKRQIYIAEKTCKSIREIVSQTTWAIRETERMWLSPPDNLTKGKKSLPKELYKQLEFIVDTAKLTENPAFASRIYPEDKHEIIAVLDPVLRELTNCYMSIYVLHNLLVVDTNYLKQLVSRFPKGNLVVRDWLNDPSNEVDSEGIEMASEELDVDVDELFQ